MGESSQRIPGTKGWLLLAVAAIWGVMLGIAGCATPPYQGQPQQVRKVALTPGAEGAFDASSDDDKRKAAAEYLGEYSLRLTEMYVQNYYNGLTSTATAQIAVQAGTATAQVIQQTGTAVAITSTVDANSTAYWDRKTREAPILAMQEAEARKAIAQADAAARMAEVWAWTRWGVAVVAVVLVVGLGAWLVVQWERYRVVRVTRDKVLARLGHGWYDPERNPYPIASLGPDGRPALPKTPSDDMQERTTARAQYVDAVRAGDGKRLPRRPAPGMDAPPTRKPNGGVRFRVLSPSEVHKALPGLIAPETSEVLEAEWREVREDET